LLRPTPETGKSEIEAARAGDPWPLVKLQWGDVRFDLGQRQLIEGVCDPEIREVFVKGNTGCGKGAAAAVAICLYFAIWPDAKCIITRDTAETAKRVAFGEIKKWFLRMAEPPRVDLLNPLSESINDGTEHFIKTANPDSDEGFHGVHSEGGHTLFWFDEATAAALESRYKAADTQAQKFVATANPRTTAGKFRDAFPASDTDSTQKVLTEKGWRYCITISGEDCTNVKEKCLRNPIAPIGGIKIGRRTYKHGDRLAPDDFVRVRAIIPGQTCFDEWKALEQSPDPFVRNVFAFAKFPDEDPETALVKRSWTARAGERHTKWGRLWRIANKRTKILRPNPLRNVQIEKSKPRRPGTYMSLARMMPLQAGGLDVAASKHGDHSILTLGGDGGILVQLGCQFADTQQTVDWVIETCKRYGIDILKRGFPIGIDWGGGYGNAVGDPLRKRGASIIRINSNATPDDTKRFGNKRAEMYGMFADRIDPDGQWAESPFAIPDDLELHAELSAPEKIFIGYDGGKFNITPKTRGQMSDSLKARWKGQTIQEKLGRSPDKGDSAVLFYEAHRHRGVDLDEALEMGMF